MQNEKTKKTKSALKLSLAIIASLLVATTLFTFAIKSQDSDSHKPVLVLAGQEITIEIATSSQEKSRGLCCRDSLADHHGMLFVYDQPGDYGFWMKDTLIPLDMYWIDTNRKIVHIEHSVHPHSYPSSFRSPEPAQYILETNAGYAKKYGISVGDTASFNL